MLGPVLLDLPPEPLELASRLSDLPGLALLWDATGRGTSFLAAAPVESSEALDPEPSLPWAPRGSAGEFPRWVGVVPYEACRDCERARFGRAVEDRPEPHLVKPRWQRYGVVARVTDRVEVVGESAAAVAWFQEQARRPRRPGTLRVGPLRPPEPDAVHAERVRRALEAIRRGELYQVNLARRFERKLDGSALDVARALARRARAPFAASLELGDVGVASSSPELFLSLDPDGVVATRPIKGTRPRAADVVADRRAAEELDADAKESAELTMVIDVERNDLSRIARRGSVHLAEPPRVRGYDLVWHREAEVRAEARPGLTREELLTAMLPSGSVTGAPKSRAMELIARWESARRGLYTGAFGYLRHDGGLRLAMAIRTVTLREGVAHYHAGGGIVADSVPEREVEETIWKARQFLELGEPLREGFARGVAPGPGRRPDTVTG